MRFLAIAAKWCIPMLLLSAVCFSRHDAYPDSTKGTDTAVAIQPDSARPVIRARYYRTKGPCVRMGDSWAMPVIDGFEVVEVVKGVLKAKSIEVRPFTGGATYPKELAEDKIFTLRLTPSEHTNQQVRENAKEGYSYIWINGDELEELIAGK